MINQKKVNLLDSSIDFLLDDKPKPINWLYLNKDILNIIGDFVKKDNKLRERDEIMNEEKIKNGKIIIMFHDWNIFIKFIKQNTSQIWNFDFNSVYNDLFWLDD